MSRRQQILATAIVAMAAFAGNSLGCTVCFGDSDDPMVQGTEASVLFMVGVTYFLLGGGVISFFLLRRRARRLAEQNAAEGRPAVVSKGHPTLVSRTPAIDSTVS